MILLDHKYSYFIKKILFLTIKIYLIWTPSIITIYLSMEMNLCLP